MNVNVLYIYVIIFIITYIIYNNVRRIVVYFGSLVLVENLITILVRFCIDHKPCQLCFIKPVACVYIHFSGHGSIQLTINILLYFIQVDIY